LLLQIFIFLSFPDLLMKLLEKDLTVAIHVGFQSTGLFPLSLEKASLKALKEAADEMTSIQ
jgi:hypothetical protein